MIYKNSNKQGQRDNESKPLHKEVGGLSVCLIVFKDFANHLTDLALFTMKVLVDQMKVYNENRGVSATPIKRRFYLSF